MRTSTLSSKFCSQEELSRVISSPAEERTKLRQSKMNFIHIFFLLLGGCAIGMRPPIRYTPRCGLIGIIRPPPHPWMPPVQASIPLISVAVNSTVVHAVSQVEVRQVYVNRENNPIEAIYYFPINPDGAVTAFTIDLDGKIIKGKVKPREEAKAEYDEAVQGKTTAAMGEETKDDIFKIRVGYLKPGAKATIMITYTAEVKYDQDVGAIRFYIPTTIAPRYVSPNESDQRSADVKQMTFSKITPAPLTLKVKVLLQSPIKSITSPTHSVTTTPGSGDSKGWHSTSVELSGQTTDMDRDFVLNIQPEKKHKPRIFSEKLGTSTAMMVLLLPSFKLDEQKSELIFVLDRSGSMSGKSIELARKALLLFLHSMPADCYFNVVGFGSNFKFLFPTSVKYDDGTLQTAVTYARDLQSNMGGTEILQPMQAIYKTELISGYLRQIFLLTDGEVSNTDGVIGIAQANAHQARVFALGIGDGASHYLVEGVAKAGGGTAAFVTYNEQIDKKVLSQLKQAIQPSLTEIKLKWEGSQGAPEAPQEQSSDESVNREKTLDGYNKPKEDKEDKPSSSPTTRQSPKRIPPVHDGNQLVVFGLFEGRSPTGAILKAESPDGPLSLKINYTKENDLSASGLPASDLLHKLAAIKLVREMEREVSALPFQQGKNVKEEEERLKREIIIIAVENSISSRYTSFVAVVVGEDKPSQEYGVMETRRVPSQYAHGWHGGMGAGVGRPARPHYAKKASRGSAMNHMGGTMSQDGAMADSAHAQPAASSQPQQAQRGAAQEDDAGGAVAQSESPSSPKEKSGGSPLVKLISLQSFDGSFQMDKKLAKVLKKELASIKDAAKKGGNEEQVFATALAIAAFEIRHPDEKDSWELVAAKATKWLNKQLGDEEKTSKVINSAKQFLNA